MSDLAMCDTLRPDVDLLSPQHLANPFPTYKMLRENHPVCQVEPNGFWAVSRYKDVQFVFKEHELFSSAGYKAMFQADWLSDDCKSDRFIASQDPPEHTRRRALVNKAFVGRVINAQIPHMRKAAQSLVPALIEKDQVDFLEDFAFPYVGSFLGRITGTEYAGVGELRRWMQMEEQFTPARPSDDIITEYEGIIRRQNAYFMKVVEDRRQHPQDDLVTALVNAEIDGERLSDSMLRDALALFVASGYQTPTQMLTACILQLARHPELMAELRKSPEKIPAFIEEMLRFVPALHCALRQARRDVEIAGVTIPKDDYVLVMIASANRDPSMFTNPDTIDISRANIKRHLAFGYGVHTCIGEALARLEIKIALEALLERFSHISCPPDDQLPWAKSMFVRGLLHLPASFQ